MHTSTHEYGPDQIGWACRNRGWHCPRITVQRSIVYTGICWASRPTRLSFLWIHCGGSLCNSDRSHRHLVLAEWSAFSLWRVTGAIAIISCLSSFVRRRWCSGLFPMVSDLGFLCACRPSPNIRLWKLVHPLNTTRQSMDLAGKIDPRTVNVKHTCDHLYPSVPVLQLPKRQKRLMAWVWLFRESAPIPQSFVDSRTGGLGEVLVHGTCLVKNGGKVASLIIAAGPQTLAELSPDPPTGDSWNSTGHFGSRTYARCCPLGKRS